MTPSSFRSFALLDRYPEHIDRIVEEHGGHIDKHVGEAIMAVFGAPVSHENDVERAVRAALAIRDVIPDLSRALDRPVLPHIGIAGGEVVASGTDSAAHRAYTGSGDMVNLPSRLTDAAAPGEILISKAVRRPLAHRLDCVERGALRVKGFSQPVSTWRIAGFGARRRAINRSSGAERSCDSSGPCLNLGIDLRRHLESGLLTLRQVDPA